MKTFDVGRSSGKVRGGLPYNSAAIDMSRLIAKPPLRDVQKLEDSYAQCAVRSLTETRVGAGNFRITRPSSWRGEARDLDRHRRCFPPVVEPIRLATTPGGSPRADLAVAIAAESGYPFRRDMSGRRRRRRLAGTFLEAAS